MRKRKIRKEKEALRESYLALREKLIDKYLDFCYEIGGETLRDSSYSWKCRHNIRVEASFPYPPHFDDLEEFKKEVEKASKELIDLTESLIEKTGKYWEMVQKNKEDLNALEGKCPLFCTLTNISLPDSEAKLYCMCCKFEKTGDGAFDAHVFTDIEELGKTMKILYTDYIITPMTEEEFEKYYLMGRLGTCRFLCETIAIDYCEEMRELFKGQNN